MTTGPEICHCTTELQSSALNCCSKKGSNLILVLDPSLPMPVAARSKACVCGRLRAGIVGLNPAGGMYLLCLVCVVRYRFLRPADHSSRGVLPSVMCLSVIVKPR